METMSLETTDNQTESQDSTLTIKQTNQYHKGFIGKDLFLVEGAIRFAIYDLLTQHIHRIDKETGRYFIKMGGIDEIGADVKRKIMENLAPNFWEQVIQLEMSERIFEEDSLENDDFDRMRYVAIEITERCNHKCVHCYAESGPKQSQTMDFNTFKQVVDDCVNSGFESIQIIGGEPFMHRNIWDMIEYASGSVKNIEIFTNITLLNEDKIERISKYGNISVATSLFGSSDLINDQITKKKGSAEKIIENLKLLKKYGIPFRIGVIRMKINENDIEKLRERLVKEGLIGEKDKLKFDNLRPAGRGENSDILPTKNQGKKVPLFNPTREELIRNLSGNSCWNGHITIGPDGKTHPCVFVKDQPISNIHDKSVYEQIKDFEQGHWSITKDQIDKCKDCENRYACFDCRASSINIGLGTYGEPPNCGYDPYN